MQADADAGYMCVYTRVYIYVLLFFCVLCHVPQFHGRASDRIGANRAEKNFECKSTNRWKMKLKQVPRLRARLLYIKISAQSSSAPSISSSIFIYPPYHALLLLLLLRPLNAFCAHFEIVAHLHFFVDFLAFGCCFWFISAFSATSNFSCSIFTFRHE